MRGESVYFIRPWVTCNPGSAVCAWRSLAPVAKILPPVAFVHCVHSLTRLVCQYHVCGGELAKCVSRSCLAVAELIAIIQMYMCMRVCVSVVCWTIVSLISMYIYIHTHTHTHTHTICLKRSSVIWKCYVIMLW